jgi:hypothetical protein
VQNKEEKDTNDDMSERSFRSVETDSDARAAKLLAELV